MSPGTWLHVGADRDLAVVSVVPRDRGGGGRWKAMLQDLFVVIYLHFCSVTPAGLNEIRKT
jgi:hypothetical protein